MNDETADCIILSMLFFCIFGLPVILQIVRELKKK